jgi:hypothetical protein
VSSSEKECESLYEIEESRALDKLGEFISRLGERRQATKERERVLTREFPKLTLLRSVSKVSLDAHVTILRGTH